MSTLRHQLIADGIDSVTITPAINEYTRDIEFVVYGHGEYEDSSVLAGQYRRVFLDRFATEEEAKAAYPFADQAEGLLPTSMIAPEMSTCPPDWFDPADAGEAWDDDY